MSLVSELVELEYLQECPICGAPQGKWDENLGQAVSWGLWLIYRRCTVCHIAFMCPRPSPKSSLAMYTSNIYREVVTNKGSNTNYFEATLQQIRASRIIQIMKISDIKPARHLDVGSSLGILCYKITKEFECESWGMEPSGVYRDLSIGFQEETDQKLDFVGDLDDLEGKFDVITCIHVLEHINHPVEYLKKMKKLLTADGAMVLEVPNGIRSTGMSLWHPFIFIPESLTMVLERAGFENITITHQKEFFPDSAKEAPSMPSDIAIITNGPKETNGI